MLKNYKLLLAYDGSRYLGWEHQPGKETIQGKLEQVLSRLCGEIPDIIAAGRTDAGVHAKGMTANVFLDVSMEPDEIMDYMNRYLPDDIVVLDMKVASDRFHARYNAVAKTYCYTCFDGRTKPVFDRKYVWTLDRRLDVEKMRMAAGYLEGRHDYKCFCKGPQKKKSTVRTVDRITITRRKDYVTLSFHGDGFLRNMVRILTGTLVEVGLGNMEPQQVQQILLSGERSDAGPTAPAQGLCLMEVEY